MARAMEESTESGMCASSECDDNSVLYDVAADEPISSPDLNSGPRPQIDLPLDIRFACALGSSPVLSSSRTAMLPPSSAASLPQQQQHSNANGASLSSSPTGSGPPPLPTTQPPLMISPQPLPHSSATVQPLGMGRSCSPIPIVQQSSNAASQSSLSSSPVTATQAAPTSTSQSPSPSSAPPPIVPRRNRVGPALTPPSLPPKPESVTIRPASCAVEDENANSRRSVADMARMFSSSETPFVRRT
ncbi:hypothetical protein Tcan_02552 [Toxocara canis]|nr:hypothetical protein Tcan_02552 [Toxocara canis]